MRPHSTQLPLPLSSLEHRFWAKVQITDGCWIWQAARTKAYGQFRRPGRSGLAHRLAWEDRYGPIPTGLELDHLCRNALCVKPEHLEPVTHRENLLRGNTTVASRAAQTHCIHGHPYDDANTYRYPGGGRNCRVCRREQNKRRL